MSNFYLPQISDNNKAVSVTLQYHILCKIRKYTKIISMLFL